MILELFKHHAVRMGLSLLILLFFLGHVSGYQEWGFIHTLEHKAYDERLRFTMPDKPHPGGIVILDIDEKSLAAEGRWPWGRDKLARLMDLLFDQYGVNIVGFDVVFAEPDESSGFKVLEALSEGAFKGDERFRQHLEAVRPQMDRDALFARSMEGRRVILGYYFSDAGESEESLASGSLPQATFAAGAFAGRKVKFIGGRGYGANLELLQSKALGAGHFNPFVDADGIVRRVPMVYEFEGAYYESLALKVARTYLGVERVEPGFATEARAGKGYSGLEWLQVGDRVVPVDEQVRTLVPYRGRQGSFPYISATDVLNGEANADQLKNAIVLVGTSAPGLLDLRASPIQRIFPGVEIHANLIAGILENSLRENPAYTLGAEVVMLVISGLLMIIALPLMGPLRAALATLCLLLVVGKANLLIWEHGNLVVPIASILLMVLLLFLFNMSYGYFVESRGKRQLAGLFGQYIPPELVDEMSDDPDAFSLEGESREMSVLFTDVRGFTTISEGLDPQELSQLMSEFLTPMTRVIHAHRGTIDKYMGDAVMCFWGAPLQDPDHALHALEAGLDMLATLKSMDADFKSRGWPEIRIGVGVNTGAMNVGNMGSEFRMAYTVLGDAVNLGSRLEGLTKQYGVDMIVNETTREQVPSYAFRELDKVRVKGKDKPVTIYEPLGLKDELSAELRKELKLYRQALKLYRQQSWDMAEIQFLNLQKTTERGLYNLYAERIAHFREQSPESDWDGVYTHQTK